jgi:hypothetical protein
MPLIGSSVRSRRSKVKEHASRGFPPTLRELDELIKRLQAAIEREAASLKALPQGRGLSANQVRVHEMRTQLRRLRCQRVAAKAGRRYPKTY